MGRSAHELTLARADGSYIRLLAKLARTDVLLIDDFALTPLQDQERRDLLEILEDRYCTGRPSSPASCPQRSITTSSASRPSPTPSVSGSCPIPTGSCYKDPHDQKEAKLDT